MKRSSVHLLLSLLLSFLALNAIGGGWYGLAGAKGIPPEWLDESPFDSYFIPSLFLMLVIGGVCATAAFAVIRNWRYAQSLVLSAGIVLMVWIWIQVLIIGYVSWMQPAVFCAGLLILFLSRGVRPEIS